MQYKMPMQKVIDGPEMPNIVCNVEVDERGICRITAPGYVKKYMYKEYLDWLVFIGWAKKVENIS